jgi:putative hemolysin
MSAYAMIAYCLHKGGDVENACLFFEKGLHVCRMINGDFTETTAYSMI